MNRIRRIISGVVIGAIVIIGSSWAISVNASQDEQKAATKVATEYVNAYKNLDKDSMLKYVKDTRFKDSAELNENYTYFVENEKKTHGKLKLVGVDKGSNGYMATFEQSSDEHEAVQFSLPLVKDADGSWKILVDGTLVVDTKK